MSGRLTPQYEAEIRERAEAATPGPWWTEILPEHGGESIGIDAPGDNWIVPVQDLDEPNAEFMGHAREDVPALLAEVERQRAELAAVRAERDEARAKVEAVDGLSLPEKLKVDSIHPMYRNGYVHALADMREAWLALEFGGGPR